MKKEAKKYEIRVSGTDTEFQSAVIKSPNDAEAFARRFYRDDIVLYESAFIMMLDRSNTVIGWAKISQGGICSTVVDTRIICKYAIDTMCSGIIMVHNHPSGNPKPGTEDIKTTQKVKEGLHLFDVQLLDHLILTDDKCYSFNEEKVI